MRLNEMLGIRYPIIQGGMANIATGAFAAACSEAGALGLIGTGGIREAEGLRKEIHTLRERTSKPFGVNLMLMNPETEKMVQVCIEEKVPVVTTGAGNPGIYMEALKEAGIKVFPVVAAPILAEMMETRGRRHHRGRHGVRRACRRDDDDDIGSADCGQRGYSGHSSRRHCGQKTAESRVHFRRNWCADRNDLTFSGRVSDS